MMKYVLAIVFVLVGNTSIALADSLPSDAVSVHCEITANGTKTCLSNSSAITILSLGYYEKTGGNSVSKLSCGTGEILDNHKSEQIHYDFVDHCSSDLVAETSGHAVDGEMWLITYVPRDTRVTRDPMQPIVNVAGEISLDGVAEIQSTIDALELKVVDTEQTLRLFFLFVQSVMVLTVVWISYKAFTRMLP